MQSTLDAGEYIQGELFSEHYIEDRLRDSQQFIEMEEKADEAFRIIRHIYEQKKDVLDCIGELSLRDEFIKPVLAALEHITDAEPTYRSHKGTEDIPDFALFNNEAEKQEAQKQKDVDSDTYFDISIGLIETKRWGIDLDKGRTQTPSLQIKNYLRMTTVKWGILTNGKKWRLYCKDSSFSSNIFLEFDLQSLLEHDKSEAFQLFYAFFSHDALERVDGRSFLDDVYKENVRFAQEVEDDLEKNVYEALRVLVEGFLKFEPNELEKEDIEDIRESCLILLYRLLFLFYAESKGLIRFSSHYGKYSLLTISGDIAEDTPEYAPFVNDYWQRLKTTFAIINRGSKKVVGETGIPPYNGGLFDPDRHEFLEKYSIGDNYLIEAIDLLARRESNGEPSWVDYKTLQIRHLGSIYEKLLEYKVRLAETDLAVDKDGEYHEAEEGEEVVVDEGDLYLVTDKGERKATGSYYTPDYIVEYIVKNTVGELIDERTERARENGESEADAILDVKVLDPAMGSGHFLVGAVEYMAGKLVEAVHRDTENGIRDRGEKGEDWAKRAIVSHCIYGVDVNPLAVELAKLSLWLTTLSEGKPLSFLDHRLKCGNSLIGEDLRYLSFLPGEERKQDKKLKTPPFIDKLVEQIGEIEDIPDDSLSDIKRKEELFEKLIKSDAYKRIQTLADTRTALYFGVGKDHPELKDRYKSLAWEALKGEKTKWEGKSRASWVKDGLELAEQEHFFHWELEFPEVFFENGVIKENPGFDAVIGNPPYMTMENIPEHTRTYCYGKKVDNKPYITAHKKTNTYALFLEKAHSLALNGGIYGYICPYSWLSNDSFLPLRKLILKNSSLREITLLPLGVFKEAGIDTSILLSRKVNDNIKFKARDLTSVEVSNLPRILNKDCFRKLDQKKFLELPRFIISLDISEKEQKILSKITGKTSKLGFVCNIDRGCDTANNEKYTGKSKEKEKNPKKLLRGEDFGRYYYVWNGNYLYYDPEKMKQEKRTARPGSKDRFEADEKIILYRFLEDKHYVACYDADQHYSLGSTYVLRKKKKNVSLKNILGQINSLVFSYYTDKFFSGIKITKSQLQELPVLCHCDGLGENVDELISKKQKKERRKKEFLDWLELTYGAQEKIITEIKESLCFLDFKGLFSIIKEKRDYINVQISSKSFQNKLREEWENTMKYLRPIVDEIRNLERCINAVVFNLYGLSDNKAETIMDSLDVSKDERDDILKKFKNLEPRS